MADQFGIGAALSAVAEIYFRAARSTGRTTNLVESLKDGDRVICTTQNETRRVERLAKERGIKIDVRTVPVSNPQRIFSVGTPSGRTVLDHGWVEEFYRAQIQDAARIIDELEREASGYGAAHRETSAQAQAHLARWRV